MPNFRIVTDSGCDLPRKMIASLDLTVVPLMVNFRGESREDTVEDDIRELYDGWRKGEAGSTSAVNPERWVAAIEPILQGGEDVLVLTFSSGLSATCQSAVIAATARSDSGGRNQSRGRRRSSVAR